MNAKDYGFFGGLILTAWGDIVNKFPDTDLSGYILFIGGILLMIFTFFEKDEKGGKVWKKKIRKKRR